MEKLKADENSLQRLCISQQMLMIALSQGKGKGKGHGASSPLSLLSVGLMATVASYVRGTNLPGPVPIIMMTNMTVVNRAKTDGLVDASEHQALVRHDSRVSKAVDKQMGRAKKKFQQMDVDGNGVLDRDELLNLADWVFSSFTPGGKKFTQDEKDMEVARIMQSADSDGDGLMDFEEFEAWFRETAAGIYEKQRREASRKRKLERQKKEEEDERAKVEADHLRQEKRVARFKELLYSVRQEIVVSLGLKSKKYRQILPEVEAIDSIELLGAFCRRHVKYLPNFDISQLNEVRFSIDLTTISLIIIWFSLDLH